MVAPDRLLADYAAIPALAWSMSHWDVHCSSDMLLLRGGLSDTEADFSSAEVSDREVLKNLPYIAWLIGDAGPFGPASYAFLFRMKPRGIARPHIDAAEAWKEKFRIHLPITTNAGALLLSEGRSRHFAVGEVWTFDNQAKHAVVNGDSVRTHLIIDVAPNPKLLHLLEHAEHVPGDEDPASWAQTLLPKPPPIFMPASIAPLSLQEKDRLGLGTASFASRVHAVRRIGRMMGNPLKPGDIILAIDGVAECPVSRTAAAYLRFHCEIGKPTLLDILRDGRHVTVSMTPKADFTKSRLWRKIASIRGERVPTAR